MAEQRRVLGWSLFCAFALSFGGLLLAFWLKAQDREGMPHVEPCSNPVAQRLNGASHPEVAGKARVALEDLTHLQDKSEPADQVPPEYDKPQDPRFPTSEGGSVEVVEETEQDALLHKRITAVEEQEGEERLEAVNQLWYYAADHGVPQEAQEALYGLLLDPDPDIAEKALAALEDLWRLQEKSETTPVLLESDDPDDPEGLNLVTEGVEVNEEWTALVLQATHEVDEERRADAVDAVALGRHADAVTALTDVATFDPSPEIRYQALEALWYAAADGLDADGAIGAILEEAMADPNPDIAKLAKRALEDLQPLE
jgi:hypothetical protein